VLRTLSISVSWVRVQLYKGSSIVSRWSTTYSSVHVMAWAPLMRRSSRTLSTRFRRKCERARAIKIGATPSPTGRVTGRLFSSGGRRQKHRDAGVDGQGEWLWSTARGRSWSHRSNLARLAYLWHAIRCYFLFNGLIGNQLSQKVLDRSSLNF